jgi:multisubunit Na+/H+ antiporter MnhB subunit
MNPPPLPTPPPTPWPDWAVYRRRTDEDHLNLLSIFHLVWGLLAVVGLLGLWLHYSIFSTVVEKFPGEVFHLPAPPPEANPNAPAPRNVMVFPKELFTKSLTGVYIFSGAVLAAGMLLNLLGWRSLKARRHRIFTLILSGLNCLCVPFGTVLGIFTFIVLLRPTVRDLYEQR